MHREDFERNGLSTLVTTHKLDIQGEGFPAEFQNKCDAVFLDLPQPWLAVPSVSSSLRWGGAVCSFSPCIEQVQRTASVLLDNRFSGTGLYRGYSTRFGMAFLSNCSVCRH